MSQLTTFHVRKFSQLRSLEKEKETEANLKNSTANRWFHYPQRSNICLNIFKYSKSNCNTYFSITWKGTILDQIYIHQENKDFVSWLAKSPSLGFKQTSPEGEIMKRFQVSFSTQEEYEKCCGFLKELTFQVSEPHISSTSQQLNDSVHMPINDCNNSKAQFERENRTILHPYILTPREFGCSQGSLNGRIAPEDRSWTDMLNEPSSQHGHDITNSLLGESRPNFIKQKFIPTQSTESYLMPLRGHNPYGVFEAAGNSTRHSYEKKKHLRTYDNHLMTPNICGLMPSKSKPGSNEKTYYNSSAQNEFLEREYCQKNGPCDVATKSIPMALSKDTENCRSSIKGPHTELSQNISNTFGPDSAICKPTPELIKCIPNSHGLNEGSESQKKASTIKDMVKKGDLNSELISARAQSLTHEPVRDYRNINDRQLKKVIRKKLQDRDFIKFVRRLDKIVTPP